MCPSSFLEQASPTSNWLCEPSRELETRPLLALGFLCPEVLYYGGSTDATVGPTWGLSPGNTVLPLPKVPSPAQGDFPLLGLTCLPAGFGFGHWALD